MNLSTMSPNCQIVLVLHHKVPLCWIYNLLVHQTTHRALYLQHPQQVQVYPNLNRVLRHVGEAHRPTMIYIVHTHLDATPYVLVKSIPRAMADIDQEANTNA